MFWLVTSPLVLPALVVVLVATPVGNLYSNYLVPSKDSLLPPIECIPFGVAVLVGLCFATVGWQRTRSVLATLPVILLNLADGTGVAYAASDIWRWGRC